MSAFSAIDLEKLPPPEIIDTLDFEVIYSEMLADLQDRWPEFTERTESDPVVKILEVAAFREIILRAKINDAARSVMLAFATKNNLEHLSAFYNVQRQEVTPADPSAIPPIPAVIEGDTRLRQRTQISLEGHSTAGPVGSYIFHALNADARVKDVDVASPRPGEVVVTILSVENIGVPTQEVLDNVVGVLTAEDVRPLTDSVRVLASNIIEYDIEAELLLFNGPDAGVVTSSAEGALADYTEARHRLGHDITLSGLYAALHRPGVQGVNLIRPTENIQVNPNQAAWNRNVSIALGERSE